MAPRKQVQDMIEELRSWLPNYDRGPNDYPTTVFRLLASLPGGEEMEDIGFEPLGGIGWHEADQLGRMLESIQDKRDVEDLVRGLLAEDEDLGEARRGTVEAGRRAKRRRRADSRLAPPFAPPARQHPAAVPAGPPVGPRGAPTRPRARGRRR